MNEIVDQAVLALSSGIRQPAMKLAEPASQLLLAMNGGGSVSDAAWAQIAPELRASMLQFLAVAVLS